MTSTPAAHSKQHPLLPQDPFGERLCKIFSYLWQTITGVNEPASQWQTVTKYSMRPRVFWKLWQDRAQLVGVRFGSCTWYALLDIDWNSLYHPAQNPNALRTIRAALETIGIYRTILIRSSHSGGLHLYIPLPTNLPTFRIASALKQCLEAQGLTIAAGQLEVFPNTKAYALPGTTTEYNAHRLPLQPDSGSYLLDDDLNAISNDLGQFFACWDTAAAGQDLEELHTAIATARRNRRGRRNCSVGIVENWKQDLQTEMKEGWTGYGQTNHFLKTIACYGVVFEGLKGDALAEFVHETAINSPGYKQWCRHQHEISLRTIVWARSAEGYYWALGDSPKRSGEIRSKGENNLVPFNLSRSQDAQRRIKEAFSHLEQSGQLPLTTTARAKAISTQGISLRTLYRHLNLWHPLYDQFENSKSCKTSEPERVLTIGEGDLENSPKVADPSHSKEFYTLREIMKCDHPETQPTGDGISETKPSSSDSESRSYSILSSDSNSLILQTDQTPRRFPFSEIVTVDSQSKMLQLTLEGVSENRTVTNHESFPPVICDRLAVLVKLLQIWIDGYQSWVWQLRKIE